MFWKEDQRICSWNLLKNALQDFINKFLKKKFFFSEGTLRKIDKKTCHVEQILAIKAVGLGEGGESVKKEKFGTKIFSR